MSKLLNVGLLLGSASAGGVGTYASYGAGFGGSLSASTDEATNPPKAAVPQTNPVSTGKTDKQKISELLKEGDYQACTFKFKIKDSTEYKTIDHLKDNEVTGLFDFLDQNKSKNALCPKMAGPARADSSASKEEKIDGKDANKWEQAPADKTEKEQIQDLLKTDKFKECTFKFKPENASEYKTIDKLGDDQVGGLLTFLNDSQKTNGLCPKMGGTPRSGADASKEEKIDGKAGGQWEQAPDTDS